MQIHNLVQGSPEWDQHRLDHDNASDAPVMLGESPYKKRDELVAEVATGVRREVGDYQQGIYDSGHQFEKLALPLAEEIIGEELFQIVGSLPGTRKSASFDGFPMSQPARRAYEHKRLNEALRAAMVEGATGADLPLNYQIQMEQQCGVCTTLERVLFLATDWKRVHEFHEDDPRGWELLEHRFVWYTPNLELRARIWAGWDVFHDDVAAYVPPAPKELVVARPVVVLPAINVEVRGELAVRANFDLFGAKFNEYVATIPKKPDTDQDFADCEIAVKKMAEVEEAMEGVENGTLGKIMTVDEIVKTARAFREQARAVRLATEKVVKARKESIKGEVVAEGVNGLASHITSLNASLGENLMPAMNADFGGAIKNKRTVESLRDAVRTLLANTKINANAIAERIRANLKLLGAQDEKHAHLFKLDRASIVLKANDDFAAIVKARTSEFDVAEARHVAEETERIAAAARKQLADDAVCRMLAVVASCTKLRASATLADYKAAVDSGIEAVNRELVSEAIFGDQSARVSEAQGRMQTDLQRLKADAIEREQAAAAAPAPAPSPSPVAAPAPAPAEAPAAAPRASVSFGLGMPPATVHREPINEPTFDAQDSDEPEFAKPMESDAKIRLGALCDLIGPGFTVTADFVTRTLGVPAAGKERAAVLFNVSDFPRIRKALIERLQAISLVDLEVAAADKRRA